ncbi:30S ribosomal protein S11 [Candidatus Dojkabacteria bacterium]|uniref:Small ribosomal subunit protein uS11 n=1 Tax=Candidatus Dojkabacteria bacterium TaxID=2099670 RepID=A0A3M0Z122_9BACT|nr:MAG: 30S ribosomal protein S11 [Candidatus Dojkabacteria bacterium]
MADKKIIAKKKELKRKRKVTLSSPKVLFRVRANYNNTIVTVTDLEGNTICSSSCGIVGFKGSKKSTAYASTQAGLDAAVKAISKGAKEADVIVNGVGIGRQAAIRGIRDGGMKITSLLDVTPIPHGGCKPRKKPKK